LLLENEMRQQGVRRYDELEAQLPARAISEITRRDIFDALRLYERHKNTAPVPTGEI
jgi:hypothetical protein